MGRHILYSSEYYEYGVYLERGVAILERSAAPFPDSQVVLSEGIKLVEHFPAVAKFGLIVDMRAAPTSNDPHFELAQRPIRLAITRRFSPVVVLVSTSIGELQVARIHQGDGAAHRVTRSDVVAWKLASAGR